jgi:4-hydroxy-2-oxoheptanedioate aldolase
MAAIITGLADRARKAGRMAGIFCSSGEAAAGRIADGFHMVTPGNDVALLSRASKAAIAAIRGQAPAPTSKTGY